MPEFLEVIDTIEESWIWINPVTHREESITIITKRKIIQPIEAKQLD